MYDGYSLRVRKVQANNINKLFNVMETAGDV
jgi:hypothetical protein